MLIKQLLLWLVIVPICFVAWAFAVVTSFMSIPLKAWKIARLEVYRITVYKKLKKEMKNHEKDN